VPCRPRGDRSRPVKGLLCGCAVTLDGRVLAFAIAISLVTGIACGLARALNATKVDLLPTLRSEGAAQAVGHRRLTLKNAPIPFQVSMAVLLLAGANIFLQWVDASRAQPIGYAVDGVAMLETDIRYAATRRPTPEPCTTTRPDRAPPGVESAALTRGLPMRMTGLRLVVGGTTGDRASGVAAGMIWAGPR
jgi:hypothetical protein